MTNVFDLAMGAQQAAQQAVFGETVRYVRKGTTAPGALDGIFHQPSVVVAGLGEVGSRDAAPTFTIALADLARCQVDDELWRAGTTYRVADIDKDGVGGAVLVLELVSRP